ncbi:MAG: hypothetical protein RIS29_3080 [Bacteroidota bacterium]|jgi:hypothetical protein
MKRIGSQLVFCSPEQILRQSAVEISDSGVVTKVFSLTESPVEAASTLFFDGIISADIVSMKANRAIDDDILNRYNYVDLSGGDSVGEKSEKPLIIDFGTTDSTTIGLLLRKHMGEFTDYSVFEIIAACSFYPAAALGINLQLQSGLQSRLLLWQGCDMVNKKLTHQLHIRPLI